MWREMVGLYGSKLGNEITQIQLMEVVKALPHMVVA